MIAQRTFNEKINLAASLAIKIQNILMTLSNDGFESSLKLILESECVKSLEGVRQLGQNIITAITYRSSNIKLYAKLCYQLIQNQSSPSPSNPLETEINNTYINPLEVEMNNTANPNEGKNMLYTLKSMVLKILHLYLNGEVIFPIECVDFPFFYELMIEKVISPEEAVNLFAQFEEDNAMSEESLCHMFCWFAPEIYEYNQDLYDRLHEIFLSEHKMDSLNPAFQQFISHLPELQENNWEKLRLHREHKGEDLPIRDILMCDNIEMLKKVGKADNFDINQTIPQSVFEISTLTQFNPTLACYAAFYGSLKCFKYLIEHNCDLTKKDDEGRTIAMFAVAGGCFEIVNFLHKCNADFFGTVQIAAEYHQRSILIWLKEVKFSDVDIAPLIFHISAHANNVKHVMYCLSNGVNPNLQDSEHKTPLHNSAEFGFIGVLTLLLSLDDIDVNARDICQVSFLFLYDTTSSCCFKWS
ncbi:hypothetical protein TRFO_18764 [Tritrichomonas foetus]|uniref:Uncharacterized protein n=1 Tax=Tritrichomonas foetus TaxID=1144522 RepID=A0A1J4KL87_9EUKA|nr:hypothetical protein TRFO_18764 [Tritrichomonas foetus]|eukprot:OHT11704.1 hypothetical protein TRFO_18764 [Tritrichomonas foetus]